MVNVEDILSFKVYLQLKALLRGKKMIMSLMIENVLFQNDQQSLSALITLFM